MNEAPDSTDQDDADHGGDPSPAARAGYVSPLDAALRRQNGRPGAMPINVWDAPDLLMHVPLALDPGNVTGLDGYTEETMGSVAQVVEALTALSGVVSQVIQARETLRIDSSMTPAAQVLAVDELQGKLMAGATKRADAARLALDRGIKSLQAEMNGPITAGAHGALAAEIRSHFRTLSTAERMGALMAAAAAGDAVTLGAIAGGAPLYLSGVDQTMADALRRRFHLATKPQVAARLALMEAAADKLETAGGVFLVSIDATIGASNKTVSLLRAKRNKARTVIGAVA